MTRKHSPSVYRAKARNDVLFMVYWISAVICVVIQRRQSVIERFCRDGERMKVEFVKMIASIYVFLHYFNT